MKLQVELADGEIVTCHIVQQGTRRTTTLIDGEWPHQLDKDRTYDLEAFVFYAELYSPQLRVRRSRSAVRARLIYEGEYEHSVPWRTLRTADANPM